MSSVQPQIAIVIATYNRERPLLSLLEQLNAQTLAAHEWELWVAVDGSTDGTITLLKEWQERHVLPLNFFHIKNSGQATARHEAILCAKAPRIVVIDDDMEVPPDFLQQHLTAAQDNPQQTVVIGKVTSEPHWQRKPLYSAVVEAGMREMHHRLETKQQQPTATAFVTQNVSFPRDLYLQVGGFDAALRLDEDRELGLRFERNGGVFVYGVHCWAIHHSNVGAYKKWERRQYEYGKYAFQVWEKYQRDPYVHPLRNLVNGSRLNRIAVLVCCPIDVIARASCVALRSMGWLFQQLHIYAPAIATHKAILAIQYHLGVKDVLGSWTAVRELEQEYIKHPDRPLAPTGSGSTVKKPGTSV